MIMKKTNILLGILMLVVAVFSFSGCKKEKPQSQQTSFEQSLTNKDSTEVTNLVNQFFEYAENGKYADAAAMLYKDDVDSLAKEPQLLDKNDLKEVETSLSALPITSHSIDYIKFSETYANEVKATAVIAPAQGDMPEVKTVYYFKPVNYNGKWMLCLVDSHNGDETIVNSAQKDSMEDQYEEEMRTKRLQKKH